VISGEQEKNLLALFEISPEFLRELPAVVGPDRTLVVTQPAAHGSAPTTLTKDVVAVIAEEPTRVPRAPPTRFRPKKAHCRAHEPAGESACTTLSPGQVR
jgi:hypothetical protein